MARPWPAAPEDNRMGHDLLAGFSSTEPKSRVNCLELLQTERRYEVNAEALPYLTERGLAACHREVLAARPVVLTESKAWTTTCTGVGSTAHGRSP